MLELIVFTLFISLVSNILVKKLQLPTIIGYIITGTIIAYSFHLHDAVHNHELKEIAEFGVVFLMFTIGLEFSLSHLKRMRNEVFVAGSAQILLTAGAAYCLGFYLVGLEQKVAIVIALAIALSSTAIVMKTFNDSGEINQRHGQRTLGILIMQDIAVIPILLLLGFLSSKGESVSEIIIETLIDGVVLITLLILSGRYLLEPFFVQITKTRSDELFVGSILFIAIGASYLAHELGFSYSLGAFIAGMLIAETRFKHQAEADLIPFRDLLLGIFFITVGMQIDFDIIATYLDIILLLLLGVLVLKFIIIYALIRINENGKVALKTALSLVQIGEFSLALLELARSNALIEAPYGQIMILTIVISMILTPLLLRHLDTAAEKLFPDSTEDSTNALPLGGLFGHIVILGYGEFGREVASALKSVSKPYIIIENNINRYTEATSQNEPAVFGNAMKKEILKSAHIRQAESVIIAIDDSHRLRQVCETISTLIDQNKIIVKVHSYREKELISDMKLGQVIIENDLIGKSVAKLALGHTQMDLSSL